ncbi:unnamed protein product [Orchesella dallaii]|uniref:CCHC-type domain-containing protein n=1 Tax=Orchesella dallaii TaxID=48710 RepID=A0ABP1RPC9_9HEXA
MDEYGNPTPQRVAAGVAPPPPRRSMRSNFGVAPTFYGNPVPQMRRQRPLTKVKETVEVPLSSTNPFRNDTLQMERTSVSVPSDMKVNRRDHDDTHSIASSNSNRRRRELELHNLQLKMQQLEVQQKMNDLQLQILDDDDLEDGEILSSDGFDDDEFDDCEFDEGEPKFEFSTINKDNSQPPNFVPTPKPRTSIGKAVKPAAVVPDNHNHQSVPPSQPESSTVLQEAIVQDNSVQSLAAAIVQAVSSQNRVSERFIARQSHDSKLPIFGGNPLDWPIFHNQYQRSTVDCGYTAAQNMQRLEKCLRGDARKAVQGLMIVPDNAPKVIEKLEQRFGKPRYVIEALIATAKKVPAPKEDNIASLLDYSNAISNLVSTVETLKANQHLHNPHLMTELVDKLPAHLKLDWGKVACKLGNVSLLDLNRFVEEIAEAVSAVSTPKFKMKDDVRSTNSGRKETLLLNQDEDTESKKRCSFCDAASHKPSKCAVFLKLDLNKRWSLVKKKKACFSCLNRGHQTTKCFKKSPCGINGCDKRHSVLLHPPDSREKEEKSEKPPEIGGGTNPGWSHEVESDAELNTYVNQPRRV